LGSKALVPPPTTGRLFLAFCFSFGEMVMEHQSQAKLERFSSNAAQSGQELIEAYLSLRAEERSESFPNTARAAEIIGVSQRTIQFWIEIGRLNAIRVGKKYRIPVAALKALVLGDEAL
jgi:excisionase family DNA binding protein